MSDHRAGYDVPLPAGIRSRVAHDVNGLDIHLLEAGHTSGDRPCVLLLHGFPELAWSWRRVMPALADAGYRVIAPDQRGYGRTIGWDDRYAGDLASFRFVNLVRDAIGLLHALGVREVAAVVGHDFGASVAAWSALLRPDVFRATVLMSAPFAGPPTLPFDTADTRGAGAPRLDPIHDALAALDRPRKHYQRYYCTPQANSDMLGCTQGVHDFLRAYFHHKSADWSSNRPHRLAGWTAEALAAMPTYYIMDLDRTMPETVAPEMPAPTAIADCRWLPDEDLAVYAAEFTRTGFQGGLNWYRCRASAPIAAELQIWSGRTIDVPSAFVSGRSDWGTYQVPGALEAMGERACTRLLGCHLVDGAGHWVQQERSDEVVRLLLDFLAEAR
ncbi:MAG: alpha/beta fold hydrolase [Ectothiorhodospiraceae bacterium]|nr:alpha/beta fold hydrolase [Chromatiales bacterium]MCP5154810.1 alpha/beta fold hydrolase [Ectothiorhodospiraceae bacterium]